MPIKKLVTVHGFRGSLFRVIFLLLTLLVDQQVLDEATNDSASASGMIINILNL